MKLSYSYLLAFILLIISCTHRLSNSIYKGTELTSVQSENRLWPGVFKPYTNIDKSGNEWYHDVTISVKQDSVEVTKRPFYVKEGQKIYSNSLGGLYYYKGNIEYNKQHKTFTVFCSLDSCKFCLHLATAVPLYTDESYEIRSHKSNWVVNTNYEKNLIFKKQ